jgi:hypothetical protein
MTRLTMITGLLMLAIRVLGLPIFTPPPRNNIQVPLRTQAVSLGCTALQHYLKRTRPSVTSASRVNLIFVSCWLHCGHCLWSTSVGLVLSYGSSRDFSRLRGRDSFPQSCGCVSLYAVPFFYLACVQGMVYYCHTLANSRVVAIETLRQDPFVTLIFLSPPTAQLVATPTCSLYSGSKHGQPARSVPTILSASPPCFPCPLPADFVPVLVCRIYR